MNMVIEVSERTGIAVDVILGHGRSVKDCCIRQLYWKLLHEKKQFSYNKIARLNDRVHTTILFGIKRVNSLLETGDKIACELWGKMKGVEG